MNAHASFTPTEDQDRALAEIQAAVEPGAEHLLEGGAGTGKTRLLMEFVRMTTRRRKKIILGAPTHQAVGVLSNKAAEVGLAHVECRTADSILSLKPKVNRDRLEFIRRDDAEAVDADVVVFDECGMLDTARVDYIRKFLPSAFILYSGDRAQLPPIGEIESRTFEAASRSTLQTIVRQARGNPIIEAATILRESQGGPMNWDWLVPRRGDKAGVYLPGRRTEEWLKKAFTSPEFDKQPDTFRYLAYTNDRVAQINAQVRLWRYGKAIPSPFLPGERAVFRSPLVLDRTIIFQTREEAAVLEIDRDTYRYQVKGKGPGGNWTATIPAWRILMVKRDTSEHTVWAPADRGAYGQAVARLTEERRWGQLHGFRQGMADLQPIYAMTTHGSQGSTFTHTFVDVPDIRSRVRSNLLEAQKLFYVAATRPTTTLHLLGV